MLKEQNDGSDAARGATVHKKLDHQYERDRPAATTILALKELQVRRNFYIKRINMSDNALRALARRALGWRFDMDEKERTKLNGRAAKIVSALLKGKVLEGSDAVAGDAIHDDVMVFAQSREPLVKARETIEKEMRKRAVSLPVWHWVDGVKGFGELGLGIIVGEAGDLANYATKERLWKRLGLAVIDGERQRKKSDVDQAAAHGYSPHRRAEIWSIIDSMFKHQWAGRKVDKETGEVLSEPRAVGPYGEFYGDKKADYLARGWAPKHADNAARRYMSKLLLKHLWQEWRGSSYHVDTTEPMTPADAFLLAAE